MRTCPVEHQSLYYAEHMAAHGLPVVTYVPASERILP